MSVIRKIKVKTADPNTFKEENLGALAKNVLLEENSTENVFSKIKVTDTRLESLETLSGEIQSNIESNIDRIGNLENNSLYKTFVETFDAGEVCLIDQISSSELIIINCILNDKINMPNIVISFDGITQSYPSCFSYFDKGIKYDLYYTVNIIVQSNFFNITVELNNIIKMDFSKTEISTEKLSNTDINNFKIKINSYKVLKTGEKNQ